MIIRIIGDKWVPEDKLLVSVREDDTVKTSIPNIMKKLSIKRVDEYKLYFTEGERRCDYRRLIDCSLTWKALGLTGGSLIYMSSKVPDVDPEETIEDNAEKHQNPEHSLNVGEKDSNTTFTSAKVDTAPISKQSIINSVPLIVQEQQPQPHKEQQEGEQEKGDEKRHSQEYVMNRVIVESPVSQIHNVPVDRASFTFAPHPGKGTSAALEPRQVMPLEKQMDTSQQGIFSTHKNVAISSLPPKEPSNSIGVESSSAIIAQKSLALCGNFTSLPISAPFGYETKLPSPGEAQKEDDTSLSTALNRRFYDAELNENSRFKERHHEDGVERAAMLRRFERTAYVVSLYEFAHLELQKQRHRAEILRRDAGERVSTLRALTPEPLYKI